MTLPTKTFCWYPWGGLTVTSTGFIRPCCRYTDVLRCSDGTPYTVWSHSLEDVWTSAAMKSIRDKMKKGETISGCEQCYREEQFDTLSARTDSRYTVLHRHDSVPELIAQACADGPYTASPFVLDIKLGNRCNFKCRMCQPGDCAQIGFEFDRIAREIPSFRLFDNTKEYDHAFPETRISSLPQWTSEERFWEMLKQWTPSLRHISFAGGEPLLVQELADYLRFCIDTGASKRIELWLTTNLTMLNEEWCSLIGEFKFSALNISIDGPKQVHEFIRGKADWNLIEKNMDMVRLHPTIYPVITPTIQIYNVLNFSEFVTQVEKWDNAKWRPHLNPPPLNINILMFPWHLSIRVLPPEVRSVAVQRLRDVLAANSFVIRPPQTQHRLHQLIHILEQDYLDHWEDWLASFKCYNSIIDSHRHQRIQESLPLLSELLRYDDLPSLFPYTR